jgi:ADP-ribosylglycohydrolase
MGLTCGSSIGVARSEQREFLADCARFGMARAMANGAQFEAKLAAPSQSNGALMRATPLGVYGWRLAADELATLASLDCSLSHIARECVDTSSAYAIAVAALVRDVECSGAQAFDEARRWVEANACDNVRQWMQDVVDAKPLAAYPHGGHAKIAFEFSMFYLKSEVSFEVRIGFCCRCSFVALTRSCATTKQKNSLR